MKDNHNHNFFNNDDVKNKIKEKAYKNDNRENENETCMYCINMYNWETKYSGITYLEFITL